MDDDRPFPSGGTFAASAARRDAASLLAGESLDSYSQDELDTRISLLETEIDRVRAHKRSAAAHRIAAEALFRPKAG